MVDEIFYLHGAKERWNEYTQSSVQQMRENLTYPELYQQELDSWLANELSWESVEPMFRDKLKRQIPLTSSSSSQKH